MFTGKYGVARHIYIAIPKAGSANHAVSADWTPAAGDVKISKDGGAAANVTNLPTAIAMGNSTLWDFSITATEMQAAQVMITVADSATKVVDDTGFIIETWGNASALSLFDISTATPTVDATKVNGVSASAVTTIKAVLGLAVDGVVTTVTNQLTAAQIATGIFQDTTAGDFTAANSIGKSILNGVALGTGLTVAAVSGAVGSVTGAVGSVTGAVGSVTGAVGSVTGAVGSVTGAVGSVTGAVGSVTGNVGGNVTGSVGSIAAGGIATTSFAAGAIDAAAIAADAIGASELAAGAVDEILDDTIGDGTITVRQALRILIAGMAGKLSGAATTTVTIRNLADSADVVVATVDANGNRSAVTVTP